MTTSIDQYTLRLETNYASTAVIEAVTERSGMAPEELPPLFEVIDPESLNRLFQPMANGIPRQGGTVEFEYADYLIRVSLDPSVDITVSSLAD